MVEAFDDAVRLRRVVYIQVANGTDVLKVSIEFLACKFPPTVAAEACNAFRASVDPNPSFVTFIGLKRFGFSL